MKVCDWMSPDPVTVDPPTSVRQARRLLSYYGVRHLPVVERDALVGIVSDRDLRPDDRPGQRPGSPDERTVEDVMSAPVHSVQDTASIEDAARLMLSRRVSAAPVLDAEGSLVGLVTTTDCLLAALHHDTDATPDPSPDPAPATG